MEKIRLLLRIVIKSEPQNELLFKKKQDKRYLKSYYIKYERRSHILFKYVLRKIIRKIELAYNNFDIIPTVAKIQTMQC